jgi:cell division protein FtsB
MRVTAPESQAPGDRLRRPPRALTLAVVGIVAGVVLVIVVARVLIGQTGFAESGIEGRIAEARRQAERLELEVAQLRSPQRIHERALQLGLVAPDRIVFLTPSPAPKSGSASPGTPTTSAPPSGGGR